MMVWPTWQDRLRIWFCGWVGHRWQDENRGEPVVPAFAICARCGKYVRVLSVIVHKE